MRRSHVASAAECTTFGRCEESLRGGCCLSEQRGCAHESVSKYPRDARVSRWSTTFGLPNNVGMGTNVHMASERKAQESIGHGFVGNGRAVQRTDEWSKALRSRREAPCNGEKETAGGDASTATRQGKALEGVALARRVRTPLPQEQGARHKTQ